LTKTSALQTRGSTRRRSGLATPPRLFAAAVAMLPLVGYFVFVTWLRPVSPFFANYDPEFQYLLNSLEAFKGRAYFYADHPGGPLEAMGTAIYGLTFPFLGMRVGDFVDFHLGHPRVFLTLAHGVILVLSLLTTAYVLETWSLRGRSSPLFLGAAVALTYFAVHPMAFDSLVVWSHNSLSFALGTILLAMLYRLLTDLPPRQSVPLKSLAALSLGMGFMSAITIYLAASIAGCLVIVAVWAGLAGVPRREMWKALGVVVLGSLAGFVVGILPLWQRMPVFFDWIGALLTHRSAYLLGAPDQPLLARWTANLVELTRALPALVGSSIVLAVLALIAIVRRSKDWRRHAASWAVIAGLLFQSLLLSVFILDHPKPDYMLAVAAVMPVLVMAVLDIYRQDGSIGRVLRVAATVFILSGVAVNLIAAMTQHADRATTIERIASKTTLLQEEYARQEGRDARSLVVVWTYGTYAPCFSWWFGNDATDNAFRREIGQLCPRQLALDIWSEQVVPRQGARRIEQTPWDMIIGCSQAFSIPSLQNLRGTVSYPDMPLSCGSLSVAYRSSQGE
jgi:hypothetical protein